MQAHSPPNIRNLIAACSAISVFGLALLSFIPVFGLQTGLSLTTAATALSVLIIGNIVFQLPLGWLADKISHRLLLAGCALVTVIMLLILPLVMATAWMWPVLVIIGSTGYGVYTVALTSLGERFHGQELINGSAAFAVVWGMGALFGSVSGGWSMSSFGPHGLPLFCAAVYLLLVIGLGIRARYSAAK